MQTTSISGVTLREAVRSLLCFEMQGVCVAAASGLTVASECCPAERLLSAMAPLDKLHTSALRRLTQTEVAAVAL